MRLAARRTGLPLRADRSWPRARTGAQVDWGHVAEHSLWFTAPAQLRGRITASGGWSQWQLRASRGQGHRLGQGERGARGPAIGQGLGQGLWYRLGIRLRFGQTVGIGLQPTLQFRFQLRFVTSAPP
ncbi:MAG TPA: hypothetical protein VIH95_09305 [Acidimicrobiales bacterium]